MREKQSPLSAASNLADPRTLRSRPEPKSDAYPSESTTCPLMFSSENLKSLLFALKLYFDLEFNKLTQYGDFPSVGFIPIISCDSAAT